MHHHPPSSLSLPNLATSQPARYLSPHHASPTHCRTSPARTSPDLSLPPFHHRSCPIDLAHSHPMAPPQLCPEPSLLPPSLRPLSSRHLHYRHAHLALHCTSTATASPQLKSVPLLLLNPLSSPTPSLRLHRRHAHWRRRRQHHIPHSHQRRRRRQAASHHLPLPTTHTAQRPRRHTRQPR